MVSCQSVCTGKSCTRITWSEHPCQIFTETFPLWLSRLEPWGCREDAAISTSTVGVSEGKDSTFWAYFISSAPCEFPPVLLEMSGTGWASAAAGIVAPALSKPRLLRPSGPVEWVWFLFRVGNRQYLPTTSCKTALWHTSAQFSLQCSCRKINTYLLGRAGAALGGLPNPTNPSQPIPFTSAFRYILCLLYFCVFITCFMYSLQFSRGEMNDGYSIL